MTDRIIFLSPVASVKAPVLSKTQPFTFGDGRRQLAVTVTTSYPASNFLLVCAVGIAELALEIRFFGPDGDKIEQ